MNRNVRSALTLVAGLALAFTALPARADDDHGRDRDGRHDRDHDRDRAVPAPCPPPVAHVPPAVYTPPVAYPPPAVYAPPVAYPAPAAPVYQPIRHARWNGGWQVRELRGEYQRLDEARAQFYATWRGEPWRRARFEAWYGTRRAELDRRWSELQSWR
jgi:hypothetical protein